MIDDAIAVARRGWAVFPCRPRDKRPLASLAPHGVKDASRDLDQVAEWWEAEPQANIGLATGAASGLVVIDLDGARAEDAYARLLAAHGPPGDTRRPDGASARTGSGWHLYLALPPGLVVRNSASKVAPGVDVRGDGGYVIAPPSVHPSGGRYMWRDSPDHMPTLAPAWARILAPPDPARRPAARRPQAPRDGAGSPYATKALQAECDAVRAVGKGGRNHRLNEAAFNVGQLIAAGELDAAHAIAELAAAADDAGLGRTETDKTIASGLRAGRAHPRARAA